MMARPFDAAKVAALAERDRIRAESGARARDDESRIRALLENAAPPEACGFDAPHAPARGPVVAVDTVTVRDDGRGGTVYETTGYRGRSAMRAQDALDRIRGLTDAQRGAGRRYAALVEAVQSGGMKCSGGFMRGGGGGDSGRDFMDVFAADCDTLRRMNRAIGDGIGMRVRRVRPSDRGTKISITDRRLVEMVCLGGATISEALRAHGWSETKKTRDPLSRALAAVLERLRAF